MVFNGIEVIITYKKIRRLNARIRDGKILLSAPYFTPNREIERFLELNKNRIEIIISNQEKTDPNIMYLWGKKLNIVKVESKEEKVVVLEDIAYVFYKTNYIDVINDFYMKETLEKLKDVTIKYKEVMFKENILYNKIRIKNLKSRWGSCKITTKDITINSNLAKYDLLCLEYVFCHEIAHIKYANHSKMFHDFIYTYFKYEKEARKILKKHY